MFNQYGGYPGNALKFNGTNITNSINNMYYISKAYESNKNFGYRSSSAIYIIIRQNELKNDFNVVECSNRDHRILDVKITPLVSSGIPNNAIIPNPSSDLKLQLLRGLNNTKDSIYKIENNNITEGNLTINPLKDGSKLSSSEFIRIINNIKSKFSTGLIYVPYGRVLVRAYSGPILNYGLNSDIGDLSRWQCINNSLWYTSTRGSILISNGGCFGRELSIANIIADYLYKEENIFVWKG
jgi:hypothetical protein